MKLRFARKVDFTGTIPGFTQFSEFGPEVAALVRDKGKAEVLIVVDHAFGMQHDASIVLDHLNLSGDNPLVGPNNSIGPRFPVVNNIYVSAADTIDQEETWSVGNPLGQLHNGIAAGVRAGLQLTDDDFELVKKFGAHFYCWNLVPTMLIAAHAGLKVLALVVPPGKTLEPQLLMALDR